MRPDHAPGRPRTRTTPVRRALAALTTLLLLLGAAGCGSSDDSSSKGAGANGKGGAAGSASTAQDLVKVSGALGSKPSIQVEKPLDLTSSSSWQPITGSGPAITSSNSFVVQVTLASGRTGRIAASTTDPGQHALGMSVSSGQTMLFPALLKHLVGAKQGSRVVLAAAPADAYRDRGNPQLGIKPNEPVVMVADVVSVQPTQALSGPQGKKQPVPAKAPKLQEQGGEPTGFDFAGLAKPSRLQVFTLVKGDGPPLKSPAVGTFDYLGTVWDGSKPFDESYSKKPISFPVGTGSVIPGWDQALDGVTKGSRIVVVVPPDMGYGQQAQPNIPANSTLVFVIDVLGVS